MSLSEILITALQEAAGLQSEEALAAAEAVINWGAKNGHAGDRHYWPCRFRIMTQDERDAAIREEFNGRNLRSVCNRFGVSHATVYRALRRL